MGKEARKRPIEMSAFRSLKDRGFRSFQRGLTLMIVCDAPDDVLLPSWVLMEEGGLEGEGTSGGGKVKVSGRKVRR